MPLKENDGMYHFSIVQSQGSETFPGPLNCQICPFVIFLWGYFKNKVYTIRPRTLNQLKQKIQDEIYNITAEILRRSMKNLHNRFQECVRTGGRHLRDVILKK